MARHKSHISCVLQPQPIYDHYIHMPLLGEALPSQVSLLDYTIPS